MLILDWKEESAGGHLWEVEDAADGAGQRPGVTGAGWRDPGVFQGAVCVNETGSQRTGEGRWTCCV